MDNNLTIRIIVALWQQKIKVILFSFLGAVALYLYSYTLPKIYQADCSILPLSSRSSKVGELLSSMGGDGGAGLAALSLGLGSAGGNKLQTVLQSRSLTKRVLEQIDMNPFLYPDAWDIDKKTWKDNVIPPSELQVLEDFMSNIGVKSNLKTGLITLSAKFPDQKMPVQILNVYLQELKTYLNTHDLTLSKKNIKFLDGQVKKLKKSLFVNTYISANFFRTGDMTGLKNLVDLNLESDDDLQFLDKSFLDKYKKVDGGLVQISPDAYMEYLSIRKVMLAQLSQAMEKNYYFEQLSSEHDDDAFEVIDYPEMPYRKVSPKRLYFAVGGSFLVFALYVGVLLLRMIRTPK